MQESGIRENPFSLYGVFSGVSKYNANLNFHYSCTGISDDSGK